MPLLTVLGCGGASEPSSTASVGSTGAVGGGPSTTEDPSPSGTSAVTGGMTTTAGGTTAGSESGGILLDVGAHDETGDPGVTTSPCAYVDLLVVMDVTSPVVFDTDQLQFGFFAVLSELEARTQRGELTGYRVGVTNTVVNETYGGCDANAGLDGALTSEGIAGDCTPGAPWLDGPGIDYMSFECLARRPLATDGEEHCAVSRPLGAIERFVGAAGEGGANDGFNHGDDALFVVAMISATDENQTWTDTTPAQTKAVLDAFAGGDDRYAVVTLAGDRACQVDGEPVEEAVALKSFTQMATNGTFADVCTEDISAPVSDALDAILDACETLPPPAG